MPKHILFITTYILLISLNHAEIPRALLVLEHLRVAPCLDGSGVLRGEAFEAAGIGSSRVGNGTCHDDPGIVVEVVGGIAVLVVVDIVRHACSTAEHLKLLLRLDAFGSAGNTTSSDTSVEEWAVVGATIKLNLSVVNLGDVLEVVAILLSEGSSIM